MSKSYENATSSFFSIQFEQVFFAYPKIGVVVANNEFVVFGFAGCGGR